MAIFALVVIAGCEKDLYDEHLHQGKVKSEISLEQFKRETGLNDFIPSIKIKLNDVNTLQRTSDGSYELSDFDIDTNIINKIVIDEKTTYTFQLIPKEFVDDRFFNIIYFYKNGWQTQILEIKPTTENLIQLKAGTTTNVDGTISKLYSSDLSLSTQSCVTFNIYTEHCTGTGDCETTGECDGCNLCVTRIPISICGQAPTVVYIDANGSVGGGASSGSSSSNNNNPDDEIATAPVLSTTFLAGQEQAKTPCTLLNKLKIDNGFIGRMKNLAYASNSYAFEFGQMIYDNTTNPTNANNYTYLPFQGQANAPIASYTGNTTMQGVIHSHYIGASLSIFSVDDLADLYEKMKVEEVTDDFFLGVVCPQGNAYIMQVNDRAAFIAFGDKHLSTEDKKRKFDVKFCQKKYNIKMDNSTSDNENGFVKMLKEMNIGTNIAKSTFVPSPTITSNTTVFKDWTKLNYNETTQTVEPQTCN